MTPISQSQLANIRNNAQFTNLYLAKFEPNIVFQAQINNASILKGAQVITFDNVITGAYTNIVNGQTLYIGSQPGGFDLGRVRVRSATSTQLTVAVDDAIFYADNQYLTVKDFYEIWPVFPFTSLNTGTKVPTFYKDWDITYSNQNENFDPVIIMGPDFGGFYLTLTGGTNGGVYFTATGTYTVDGSTISTYAWTFPAGCSPSSSSAGTPGTVVFPAPGMYTVSLVVTASNGKTSTAHRHVALLNRAYGTVGGQPWNLGNGIPRGQVSQTLQDIDDWEFGNITEDSIIGATAKITVRDRANEFRDGDLVVIFAEEFYSYPGSLQPVSYGGYSGRESIKFIGYVDQAETTYDFATSKTDFILKGTAAYLQNKQMFSVEVHDTQGTPPDWTYIKNMTINKALNHYVRWHSTLLNVKDFRKLTTGQGDYTEDVIQFQKGELLNNLSNFTQQKLLGFVSSDRQGTFYTEIDLQITLTGSRPASVMTFVEDDWLGTPKINEIIEQPLSDVLMGGIAYNPNIPFYITGVPLLSRAPGQWQTYVGKSQNVSGLTLTDQSQLNNISGLYFAKVNNETPELILEMANNYGNIDIYPQEFYNFNISGTVTYRGFPSWTPRRVIPRKITYKIDKFALRQTITFEPETYGPPGDTIVIPVTVPGGDCTDCIPPQQCNCDLNPACDGCPPPIGVGDGNTVYVFANGLVGRSRNFLASSPNWTNVTNTTSGGGAGTAFDLDPWNPIDNSYRLYANVLEKTTNLNSTLPTWSSVLTNAAVQTAMGLTGVVFLRMGLTITENGVVYVAWYSDTRWGMSTTRNGGSVWAHHLIDADLNNGNQTIQRVVADQNTPGVVYVMGGNRNFGFDYCALYRSTNYGANWTNLLAPAFCELQDFDVSYPDGGRTIVAKACQAAAYLYYSHDSGASWGTGAFTQFGSGNNGKIKMNIATTSALDVVWVEDSQPWWSTDGGVSWTGGTRLYGPNFGFCPGINIVSMGRWPYDLNKVFWLVCPGGVNPASEVISYSSDKMVTVQNKRGDWDSAVGAFSNPIRIIPLWLGY